MKRNSRKHRTARRGGTSIAMLIVIATIGLLLIGMVHSGARDQLLTVRRLETVRSFYAAEAGVNMAVRELAIGVDEDGDGVVGSISDDGDEGNDPAIGFAVVGVSLVDAGGSITLTSRGRSGEAIRKVEAFLFVN